LRASGIGCGRESGKLAFEVEQNAFEVVLVEDLFLFGRPQEQGIATDVVDLAGHALGVVVDAAEETVTKELALVARDVHVVLDVPGGLFEVKGSEMVADGDALVESFIGRKAELVSQVGLAEKDEGDQRSRIHVVVEQEAQLVKEVRCQEVCFVDNEKDVTALASQVVERGAELGEETHKAKGWFYLESEEDFPVEGCDAKVRVGEIDYGVEIVVERLGKGTDGGRFSSPNIAGEEGRKALLEGKGQAALGLTVTMGSVEVLAVDRFGERGDGKAVKVTQCGHLVLAPCQRVVRAG
jgi:hypothetical protein